jgi:hypothetical protein
MKKALLLLVFAALMNHSFAQGNLQFNRVVNYNLTGNLTTASSGKVIVQSTTITVPNGKVLKIESATCRLSTTTSSLFSGDVPCILLNNNIISVYRSTGSGGFLPLFGNFPMWLPEGSHTLQLVVDVGAGTNETAFGMVTGIEFNIIP